jgi:hypothetical protein
MRDKTPCPHCLKAGFVRYQSQPLVVMLTAHLLCEACSASPRDPAQDRRTADAKNRESSGPHP